MSDKNSHTILTEGDDYYAKAAPKGDNVMPFANEPWRSELAAMHGLDQRRQTEAERVAARLLALAPDAPEEFAVLVRSYPVVAAYLLPIFMKANCDAKG
ncbi:hypothetical protein [Mesorhizobium sp. M0323]|uniref:hypothetical protein n=1 Tax=Mesorhizobium sp. M0323 TaxID=2956938 RepID=UPI00333D1D82